jgi:hypothetical protein
MVTQIHWWVLASLPSMTEHVVRNTLKQWSIVWRHTLFLWCEERWNMQYQPGRIIVKIVHIKQCENVRSYIQFLGHKRDRETSYMTCDTWKQVGQARMWLVSQTCEHSFQRPHSWLHNTEGTEQPTTMCGLGDAEWTEKKLLWKTFVGSGQGNLNLDGIRCTKEKVFILLSDFRVLNLYIKIALFLSCME